MTSVYTDADYLSAYKQKQKLWWIFFSITVVYLAICISLLIYHISLPYASPKAALPKWTTYILSGVYMIFAFPYMAIKFSRVRRYVKLLSYISIGLKQNESNYFYCFDDKPLPKDNVDVNAVVFEIWDKKNREWREREVYFDREKPLPPFESGDVVHYVLQGQFIIQYEIVQKRAIEFEEVEDDFEGEALQESEENEET